MTRRPQRSPLFPYPTLSRSSRDRMPMNPLNRRIIDQWHRVALSGDRTARDAMFHDDAVFESPVVHTPQRGKAITIKYLAGAPDRKSTRLNSSHSQISYAVFC